MLKWAYPPLMCTDDFCLFLFVIIHFLSINFMKRREKLAISDFKKVNFHQNGPYDFIALTQQCE